MKLIALLIRTVYVVLVVAFTTLFTTASAFIPNYSCTNLRYHATLAPQSLSFEDKDTKSFLKKGSARRETKSPINMAEGIDEQRAKVRIHQSPNIIRIHSLETCELESKLYAKSIVIQRGTIVYIDRLILTYLFSIIPPSPRVVYLVEINLKY